MASSSSSLVERGEEVERRKCFQPYGSSCFSHSLKAEMQSQSDGQEGKTEPSGSK